MGAYLTVAEVATHLNVTPDNVRKLIRKGYLKARRTGQGLQIYPDSLETAKHRPTVGRPRKDTK